MSLVFNCFQWRSRKDKYGNEYPKAELLPLLSLTEVPATTMLLNS